MTRPRSHLLPFLALLLLALLLILLDQGQRLQGPQDWGQRLTAPAESGMAGLVGGLRDFWDGLRDAGRLRADNEAMRAQLEQLTLVNVRVLELEQENERLRELLAFKEANPNYLLLVAEIVAQEEPARVVGQEVSNLARAVRINQGRDSGIEPGMSVITPSGLVGRVQEVGEGWAKVLLIIDSSSRITALVQQSRAGGVVEGTGDGLMMRYIPHEQRVEPGDVVLSAGLGGQFPKGLVLGVVESVVRNDVNPWQEAVLRAPVSFGQLEYLFVVRSFVPSADEEADPAPDPTPAPSPEAAPTP